MGSVSPMKKAKDITVDFSPRNGSAMKIDRRPSVMEELVGLSGINTLTFKHEGSDKTPMKINPLVSANDGSTSLTHELGDDQERPVCGQSSSKSKPRRQAPGRTISEPLQHVAARALGRNKSDELTKTVWQTTESTVARHEDTKPKRERLGCTHIESRLKPLHQAPGRTYSEPLRRAAARFLSRNKSDELTMMVWKPAEPTVARHEETEPKRSYTAFTALQLSTAAKAQAKQERRRRKEMERESLQQMLNDLKRVSVSSLRRCKSDVIAKAKATEPPLRRAVSDERPPTQEANEWLDSMDSTYDKATPTLKTNAYEGVQSQKKVIHAHKRRDVGLVNEIETSTRIPPSRTASARAVPQERPSIKSFASSRLKARSCMNTDLTVIDERPEAITISSVEQVMFNVAEQFLTTAVPEIFQSLDSLRSVDGIQAQKTLTRTTSWHQSLEIRPDIQRFSAVPSGNTPATATIDPSGLTIIGVVNEDEHEHDSLFSQAAGMQRKSRQQELVRAMSISRGRFKIHHYDQGCVAREIPEVGSVKAVKGRDIMARSGTLQVVCHPAPQLRTCQDAMESTASKTPPLDSNSSLTLSFCGVDHFSSSKPQSKSKGASVDAAPSATKLIPQPISDMNCCELNPRTTSIRKSRKEPLSHSQSSRNVPRIRPKLRGNLLRYVSARFERNGPDRTVVDRSPIFNR
jgi:hypothetical protein